MSGRLRLEMIPYGVVSEFLQKYENERDEAIDRSKAFLRQSQFSKCKEAIGTAKAAQVKITVAAEILREITARASAKIKEIQDEWRANAPE